MPAAPILTLAGITKSFPGVRALHDVALTLRAGEVMGLIGENGAGKSTLVKIITGIYQADAGEMRLDGALTSFASPRAAWEKGLTAIHQETAMFDDLSVAENIFMGHAPKTARGLIDWRVMREKAAELLARLEARIDPSELLKRLGVAQKHLVSIARVLSHGSRVIIMDEPTAALSAHEIDDLFRIIAQLKSEGHAIVFISHKFDEIFRVCDRWTCLRDGEQVGEGVISDVSEADLVRLMVGRPIDQVFPKRVIEAGAVALEVEDLSNASEFDGVSFSLRRGEILGLYGLVGAGRSEAMQGLFGLSRLTRGRVSIDGAPVTIASPGQATILN